MNDTLSLIEICRDRGVSLQMEGDDLWIEPVSKVYDIIENIVYLKQHIISVLERAKVARTEHFEYDTFDAGEAYRYWQQASKHASARDKEEVAV